MSNTYTATTKHLRRHGCTFVREGSRHSCLQILLLGAIAITLSCGHVLAAESDFPEAGVFFLLGGGSRFHVGGVVDDTRPAVQLGVGYSWNRLAVEADLMWTDMKWKHQPGCIEFMWGVGSG